MHMQQGGLHWPLLVMFAVVLLALLGVAALVHFFSRPVAPHGTPARNRPISQPAEGAELLERSTYLVIPDISGYTRFMHMTRFAAGHAQLAVARLLQAMIDVSQPPLTATRVEGDSVMFFAVAQSRDEQQGASSDELVDVIMNIVNAFYRCRDSLVARNLCPCAACQYIAELDVKIIVHRGGVVHYRIGGMQDLSGMAVIEAHRLLKNSVGRPRYVLVTEAAGEVSLPWERSDGAHAQTYDEIGEIRYDVYLFEPPLPDVAATRAHVPVREKTGDLGAKFARNVRTLANNLRRL